MTYEEIEKAVDAILSVKTFLEALPGGGAAQEFAVELKRFCRGLVSQAHEEDASRLQRHCAFAPLRGFASWEDFKGCGECFACKWATELRALKDSLVKEEVPA